MLSRGEYEVFPDILAFITSHRGECPDNTDLGDHRNSEAATVTQTLSQEPCDDLVKAPRPSAYVLGRRIREVFTDGLGLVAFLVPKESYLEVQRLQRLW